MYHENQKAISSMSYVNYPLAILFGIGLLLFLTYDLFKTIVQSSDGVVTYFVQRITQRAMTALYHLTNRRIFLVWTSSLLIVSLIIIWVALLYGGWLAIFAGDASAVVNDSTLEPATFGERIYFTGFTISTLGVGDYIPNGTGWQVVTTIAALSGFTLVTFLISFLVSIAQKQALRRKLALSIHYLGETPTALVLRNWDRENEQLSAIFLSGVIADLVQFQQQQIDQPILSRLHGPSPSRSLELSLVVLDEALTIIQCATNLKMPRQFEQVRRVLTDYLSTLDDLDVPMPDMPPPIPQLDQLTQAGIPLRNMEEITICYDSLRKRRKLLLALADSTGWDWDMVTVPILEDHEDIKL